MAKAKHGNYTIRTWKDGAGNWRATITNDHTKKVAGWSPARGSPGWKSSADAMRHAKALIDESA